MWRILGFIAFTSIGKFQVTHIVLQFSDLDSIWTYNLYQDLILSRIGSVTPYQNAPVTMLTTRFSSTLSVLKLNMLGLTDAVMPFIANCILLRVLYLWRLITISDESFLMLKR